MMIQGKNNQTDNEQGKENGVFHLGYKSSDDIYNKSHNETDIDPENILQKKSIPEDTEQDFDGSVMGGDLDVPGSELDDAQEEIGAEDEENNYYSLGLDNHNELEENKEE